MNPASTIANSLWTASNLPFYLRFRQSLRKAEQVQTRILERYIQKNRDTAFGRAHCFAKIRTYDDFVGRVPLSNYESTEPWIDRIAHGETNVLLSEPVTRLVPTSGSSGARKLIPFTNGLQCEFNFAIGAWLFDLFRQRPSIAGGPAYWSITPALGHSKIEATTIPIGFDTDASYLSGARRWLADAVMAIPQSVGSVADLEVFRYVTLLHLLRNEDLRIISVWHPSFLLLLLETLATQFEHLVGDIYSGRCRYGRELQPAVLKSLKLKPTPKRATQLQRADPKQPLTIWRHLQVVSCWGDALAENSCRVIEEMFPTTLVQRKGLLATEAFVTIPFDGRRPATICSHFFEFIGSDGTIYRIHELREGEIYEVVVTTAGGLWRYRLGDRVIVDGWCNGCPSLTFVGRTDDVCDLCGEKLSEPFVAKAIQCALEELKSLPGFIMLAPESDVDGLHYTLFVEGNAPANLACIVEGFLRENLHYAYCRDLEQLKPVQVCKIAGNGYSVYTNHMNKSGQRIGDIKPVALSKASGWRKVFGKQRAN